MQGFRLGFDAYEFNMWACYPKACEVISPLIPHNALLEEIIEFVVQRKKRLKVVLKLTNSVLSTSLKK